MKGTGRFLSDQIIKLFLFILSNISLHNFFTMFLA